MKSTISEGINRRMAKKTIQALLVAAVMILAITNVAAKGFNQKKDQNDANQIKLTNLKENNLLAHTLGETNKESPVALQAKKLNKYVIEAYAVQGFENQGEFKINGEQFVTNAGQENHQLENGAVVGVDNTLIQNVAGGLRGVDWDLAQACPSLYAFKTYFTNEPGADAHFEVVSTYLRLRPIIEEEIFTLKVGETKLLRDGARITLLNVLSQDALGGLHGVEFVLTC